MDVFTGGHDRMKLDIDIYTILMVGGVAALGYQAFGKGVKGAGYGLALGVGAAILMKMREKSLCTAEMPPQAQMPVLKPGTPQTPEGKEIL